MLIMTILTIIPDNVTLTREVFAQYLRKFKHHRDLRFGFSVHHTKEINRMKKESSIPGNLYNLPVEWNAEKTYIGH